MASVNAGRAPIRPTSGQQARLERGKRAARLGILANALLAAFKLVAGIAGHSYALVADASEASADGASSTIGLGGRKGAGREQDEKKAQRGALRGRGGMVRPTDHGGDAGGVGVVAGALVDPEIDGGIGTPVLSRDRLALRTVMRSRASSARGAVGSFTKRV